MKKKIIDILCRKNQGFTLLELLVVIAIIGVLASAIFASLGVARARSRDAQREENIKSLQTALALYVSEGGNFPVWSSGTTVSKALACTMSPGLPPAGNDIFDALKTRNSLGAAICDPFNDGSYFYEYKTTDAAGNSYEIRYSLETNTISGKNQGAQPPATP